MKRIVVGMSGASGSIIGIRLLEALSTTGYEVHLVVSEAARLTLDLETEKTIEEISELAHHTHDYRDVSAPIASGSFRTDGMIVAPCSMKTLSAIAHSFNTNLLIRAADVCLKEKRKLVLVARETPLHKGHLELLSRAHDLGAILLPPMLTFYTRPKSIDDMINHTVGKILDSFGVDNHLFRRWGEA